MGLTLHPHRGDGVQEPPGAACERILPAWNMWLSALAWDAEAALGAALAYEALEPDLRNAFLDTLDQDASRLDIPRVALYAPFLSVETDPKRYDRIRDAIGEELSTSSRLRAVALHGLAENNERIAVVVSPMYLDFVRSITCRYSLGRGFAWIRCDPLVHVKDAPRDGAVIDGIKIEMVPLTSVIDEIAQAVVSQRDPSGNVPPALKPLLDLFDAGLRDQHEEDWPGT